MVSCCVFGCAHRTVVTNRKKPPTQQKFEEKYGRPMKLIRFPKDLARRKQWLVAIRRAEWTPKNTSRICEIHFESRFFRPLNSSGKHYELSEDAVPTIFPSFPKHLHKISFKMNLKSRRKLAFQKRCLRLIKKWAKDKKRIKKFDKELSERNSILSAEQIHLMTNRENQPGLMEEIPHMESCIQELLNVIEHGSSLLVTLQASCNKVKAQVATSLKNQLVLEDRSSVSRRPSLFLMERSKLRANKNVMESSQDNLDVIEEVSRENSISPNPQQDERNYVAHFCSTNESKLNMSHENKANTSDESPQFLSALEMSARTSNCSAGKETDDSYKSCHSYLEKPVNHSKESGNAIVNDGISSSTLISVTDSKLTKVSHNFSPHHSLPLSPIQDNSNATNNDSSGSQRPSKNTAKKVNYKEPPLSVPPKENGPGKKLLMEPCDAATS